MKWQASQGQTQDIIMRENEWNINPLQKNFIVSARIWSLLLWQLVELLPDPDHHCSRNHTYKQ